MSRTRHARGLSRFALLACVLAGCADASHGGYFDSEAFYATRQHFRVRYVPEGRGSRALLGPDWRPTSFAYADGMPVEIAGSPIVRRVAVDVDGDRRPDASVSLEHDLHFEHRRDGATMIVTTLPLDPSLGERSLDVLLHEMLDAASEARASADSLQVIRTLYEGRAEVGGASAYQAVFEGAALGAEGRVVARSSDRAFLVLVRPSAGYAIGGRSVPMVVLFWLFARQEHFDAHVPELRSLLERTDFREAVER